MTALPNASMSNAQPSACMQDPDRWATATEVDEEAKALCRACPRRWDCAREACRALGVQGIWAGVFVPESGRTRAFALGQLRSLAEHGKRRTAK